MSALQRQDPTSSQAAILELATEQFDAHACPTGLSGISKISVAAKLRDPTVMLKEKTCPESKHARMKKMNIAGRPEILPEDKEEGKKGKERQRWLQRKYKLV